MPTGKGMLNFITLTFCLMVGTAGLPHILTRYYTTPSVREARTSVAWSLFFIFLLYFTAPAYASFARNAVFTDLVGAAVLVDLPQWVTLWAPAGLFTVVDKLGDGVVQLADFVVKSTDFVVLATPEIAGLPFTITGLVMAGGLAAALSTADGLLLTIANAFSHDLYFKVINPKASLIKRLTITKILLITVALIAAWTATARLAIIVEMVAWAFSIGAASFFPALVMGIWWKRANWHGAVAGMLVGFGLTIFYMVGSRFFGLSWLDITTVSSGVFGIPAGFLTIYVVSLLTPAPTKEMQDFVTDDPLPEDRRRLRGHQRRSLVVPGGAEGTPPPRSPSSASVMSPNAPQDRHGPPARRLHGAHVPGARLVRGAAEHQSRGEDPGLLPDRLRPGRRSGREEAWRRGRATSGSSVVSMASWRRGLGGAHRRELAARPFLSVDAKLTRCGTMAG